MQVKLFFALQLIVVLLLASTQALAQKKLADFNELDQLRSRGFNAIYSGPRRVESGSEAYENGHTVKSDHTLSEWLSSDRSRYVTRRMENGETLDREVITIGYFQYSRVNSGPWTKIDLRNVGSGSGSGSGIGGGACSVRQLTVEQSFLGNLPARLFERIEIRGGKDGLMLEENRTWIGDDGALLQEETLNSSFEPRTLISKRWSRYEANPNIKIEAPLP